MKKLFVLILLVTMLLPAIGIAESDFTSMTDEQLLLLNKELVVEMLIRDKTAFVPMGYYLPFPSLKLLRRRQALSACYGNIDRRSIKVDPHVEQPSPWQYLKSTSPN